MNKGKDETWVPPDYIVHHTKTDNIVSIDKDGNYVCDIETEYIPLVRCKECKHREEYPCKVYHDDDWYCADGEREGE